MSELITVYLPMEVKQADGKFYKEWEVPEGLPLGMNVLHVGPSEDLKFPRWDAVQGIWVEDKDSIIKELKEKVKIQEVQIANAQEAITNALKQVPDIARESVKEMMAENTATASTE